MVYLLMKRTTSNSSSRRICEASIASTVIYDLPNIAVDDVGEKTMQHNASYGVL